MDYKAERERDARIWRAVYQTHELCPFEEIRWVSGYIVHLHADPYRLDGMYETRYEGEAQPCFEIVDGGIIKFTDSGEPQYKTRLVVVPCLLYDPNWTMFLAIWSGLLAPGIYLHQHHGRWYIRKGGPLHTDWEFEADNCQEVLLWGICKIKDIPWE